MIPSSVQVKLEDFDTLFVGHPVDIERNLTALLTQADSLPDKSLYIQILSQIALAQAMQQRFAEAHQTLDHAESHIAAGHELARARVILERGRVFHQAGHPAEALPLFEASYALSSSHRFDFHTVNAAHMAAIVSKNVDDKIAWNTRAIELAADPSGRAHAWMGALSNNLAQNYIEAGRFSDALATFKQCQLYGEQRGDAIVVRGAKWGIGRALRPLGRLDDALQIQLGLLEEYTGIESRGELPAELIAVGRGMIHEELAEIHLAYANTFAALAYRELCNDPWFGKLEPARLERLKRGYV